MKHKIIKSMVFMFCALWTFSASAECTTLQGVTLCDNGDSRLQMGDQIYTLKGDKLSKEQVKECYAGALYNGRVYSLRCDNEVVYSLLYGLSPDTLSAYGVYLGDK